MTDVPAIENEEDARAFVRALCDEDGFERIERFISLLIAENARQNLISVRTIPSIWQRHIADSAQLFAYVSRETSLDEQFWLDLGSGPGLPGIVLAILRPEIPIWLIESRKRRVEFLSQCVEELHLKNANVIGMRLQDVEPTEAQCITARAFAPLPRLLDLAAPFSTASTTFLLPKGRSAAQELARLPTHQREMFHVEQSLTDRDAGIIVGQLAG
ncbi:MAG: 16S rRNA (guanine(527)-N(7))-methyltransferase RsmG [Erythrobacter sp.]